MGHPDGEQADEEQVGGEKPADERSFEENLARLEEVVQALEEGDIPLEKSLSLYEEGVEAYKCCRDALDEAEGQIKKLVEDLEGNLVEEEFEPPGDAE
jgi:exodeoxyribonuclease VII small subunit